MKVVIIGSGNVATVLGKKMKMAGIDIIQVVSRNQKEGARLADKLGVGFTNTINKINTDGDLYIITVSDNAIHKVAETLKLHEKLIAHTAGSVSKKVLLGEGLINCSFGVIYPLQSLNKENENIPIIPVLIDGDSEETIQNLNVFTIKWADKVAIATDEQRLKMHLSAVFANNFSNYMFTIAERICTKEDLDFTLLTPIISETLSRLHHFKPSEIQTGPAIRKDYQTIEKHIVLLSSYPAYKHIYEEITTSIVQEYHK